MGITCFFFPKFSFDKCAVRKTKHGTPNFVYMAFVLLYKFETSWALLGRLSRSFFFLPSQGLINFKLSGLGLLIM